MKKEHIIIATKQNNIWDNRSIDHVGGGGPWRDPQSRLLFMPSPVQQGAQGIVTSRCEYIQGWSSHSLSGQPAPILDYSHPNFPLYQVGVSYVPAGDCCLSSFQSAPLTMSFLRAPNR